MTGEAPGRSPYPDRRRAVFLDRDGTVISEEDYLDDPDGVELLPGAAAAIRALKDAGLAVVIVTNQSGIARGLYSLDDYRAVAARLDEILAGEDASPAGTYYCPHHPEHTGPCDCRKPFTGMYERAAQDLDLSLPDSYYVGDKVTDVLPARALRGTGILVRTGYGRESEPDKPPEVTVVDGLPEAAERILEMEASGNRGP